MEKAKDGSVQVHGWDFQTGFWHGPNPLARPGRGARGAAPKLRKTTGAFHGKLLCSVPGLPCIEFHTAIYDLLDIGLAIIHVDGASGGPAGLVAVIPAARRSRLRTEFPFEFVTSLSFLGGPQKPGSELAVHDYIEEVLRTETSTTLIFTIETADLSPEVSIVLSEHFVHLSGAMVPWLAAKDSTDDVSIEFETSPICASEACAAAAGQGSY